MTDSQNKILKTALAGSRLHKNLAWLKSPRLCQWVISLERREALYPEKFVSQECLRIVHKEGTPLRVDKLGSVAALGWWDARPPSEEDWLNLRIFLSLLPTTEWVFRHYSGKNETNLEKSHSPDCPEVWQGTENQIIFEFRRNQGVSAGLFLDQRDHRQWLKSISRNQRVLNLFAYTGGFSVYAAKGGAALTATVDLSQKYIDWCKQNFTLNGLQLEPDIAKFHSMDSLDYLKYAIRKNLKYDVVICDPPSYSRNKSDDFRIDRDHPKLIESMAQVLAPKGTIFFSTNYENWDAKVWHKELEKVCKKSHLTVQPKESAGTDFELNPSDALMKAFHIKN